MNTGMFPIRRARRQRLALLVAASVTAVGCVAPLTPMPAPRPLGRDLDAISPGEIAQGAPREPFQEPEGVLTLPLALAASLRASPALESFAWQVRAEEARCLRLRPAA